MRPRFSQLPSPKLCLLLSAWFFLPLRPARAEDSISYKFVDYRESDDRVSVRSHYGLVEHDFGPDTRLKLHGVIDAIAGATPTGQPPPTPGAPVPLSHVTDRRKAWSADLAHQFSRVNVAAGYANSRESDYVSNGWSLNTLTDFNQKNTTMLLGIAGTDDDVKVLFQPAWLKKRGTDLIAGITQLLDPLTSVTINFGYGRATGYMADPYRVVEQRTEIAPNVFLPLTFGENRPQSREKRTLFASINRSLPGTHAAIQADYRFYDDTFGTSAHTVELTWFQKLGERIVLAPSFRFYDQTAADFYRLDITGAGFNPSGRPVKAGPFYSADYRLSAFRSYDYGLKLIWTIAPAWQIDASIDRYEMRGKDQVTSPSVYPQAVTTTVGLKFSW